MDVKKEDSVEDIVPSCSQPLGGPIPNDEHACSVSLPSWAAVVGYEEGDVKITSSMKCGYPRFVYHPTILQLMNVVVDRFARGPNNKNEDCLLVPGYAAALRCQAFLQQALEGSTDTLDNALICHTEEPPSELEVTSSNIRIINLEASNVYAVMFLAKTVAGMQAKAYWQHTGEIVSSRRAEEALCSLGIPLEKQVTCGPQAPYIFHPSKCAESDSDDEKIFKPLRKQIAKWCKMESENQVFLTPSGMSSIYTALRSARRFQLQQGVANGGRSVVYGFPYLDTLKMCSRRELCPGGVEFFGKGDEQDLKLLEQLLSRKYAPQVCALFTEVPSNPLLQCPDLRALRKLADEHNFALIVDDTIGNFLNIDMIHSGIADAVCTSLTKLVSGRGDAIAGSVVCNPFTEKGRWMQRDLEREFSFNGANDTAQELFNSDARAILHNSCDFEKRNQQINETSEILADWLVQHEDVETVYYPKYTNLYPSLLNSTNGGYGGLMSILLQSHMCQRTFYDSLNVAKGPSLGTNFTLVCPYTLLARK